jgi:hypothetical protein
MKHPVYAKCDLWPSKSGISWTVLLSHGSRKEREAGIASNREGCDAAIRGSIDAFLSTVDKGTALRFHKAS